MTAAITKRVLLIGYGNPAREDDGLGPLAAEAVEKLEIDGVTVEADYQLTVEDAATVSEHDVVVFIDASVNAEEPFSFFRVKPSGGQSFSSHSVEPEAVIGLAVDLFNAHTEAYLLGIRGYSFSMFIERMTEKAGKNLEKAVDFIVPLLHSGAFSNAAKQSLFKQS